MQLNDFLDKPEFADLKKTLVDEMYKYAGKELVNKMNETFGNEMKAMDWFYTPSLALLKERPYDWCKKGGALIVYDELDYVEHGIFL